MLHHGRSLPSSMRVGGLEKISRTPSVDDSLTTIRKNLVLLERVLHEKRMTHLEEAGNSSLRAE